VPLARTLADARKDGDALVAFRHRVDKFHDHDGLSDAGAAEHGRLAALRQGSEQIDDLNAGLEYGGRCCAVFKWRSRAVDGRLRQIGRQRRAVVADIAGYVEETTEKGLADRYGDRTAGRTHWHPAFKSGGRLKSDPADSALVEMCLNLNDEDYGLVPLDDKGFVDVRKFGTFKGDVDHRPTHGENLSARLRGLRHRDDHI